MNRFETLVYAQFILILVQASLGSLTTSISVAQTGTITASNPSSSVTATGVAPNNTVLVKTSNNSFAVATTSVGSNKAGSVAATSVDVFNGSTPMVATHSNITTSVATTSVALNASLTSMVATHTGNASASMVDIQPINTSSGAAATSVMPALNNSSSVTTPGNNTTTTASVTLTTINKQTINSTVSKPGNGTQIVDTASSSMRPYSTQSPSPQSIAPSTSALGLKPTLNSSTPAPYPSANSTVSGNASTSLQPSPTPSTGSSVHSNETSQPTQQVSPIPSLFTSFNMTTKSSPSSTVFVTSILLQSISTLSELGQTSNTSRLPSSDGILHSPNASQSTQFDTSIPAQSSSMKIDSVMTQHFAGSLTVSASNLSSTPSPPINASSASLKTTPSSSTATPPPTLPPEGTKIVSMEVSFEIEFKKEYSDLNSPEYVELKKNLTTTLEEVYGDVEGFVAVRILFITKGSVVCSYIVILAKDSKVEESELKEKLEQAAKEGKLGYTVDSVKIVEDGAVKTDEKLPTWALAVMIVLGCLSAVFLIIVIYVCVKYRRSLYGSSDAYFVSTGEIGLVHTYDTVSMGDNKMRANQGHGQKSTAERRVIGSHTNPTYGSNGALAD